MDVSDYNETDVREGIAAPFLSALGYAKGTDADILREQDLKLQYPHLFLGRKKPGRDPVLRGRPDYVLRVIGVCRWVFEIKAPSAALDRAAIEQALSYARHPEINAELVALLNGREFKLFEVGQTADDEPILATQDCAPGKLVDLCGNVLTPAALRRDRRPAIDRGRSLGGGLRSTEAIQGGSLTHTFAQWAIIDWPSAFAPQLKAALDQNQPIIPGFQLQISGGRIERSEAGAIVAVADWKAPYKQMDDFLKIKGLNQLQYVCLDPEISSDPERPSMFDVVMNLQMEEGEQVFDMMRREFIAYGLPAVAEMRGYALGYIDGRSFLGEFKQDTTVTMTMPFGGRVVIVNKMEGTFEVRV